MDLYTVYTFQEFDLFVLQVSTKESRTSNLVTTLLSEVIPRIASSLNPRTLILDIMSHLLLIIQPSFRPVSVYFYTLWKFVAEN